MVWLKFAVCCAVILVAGTRLSKYGDVIAEKTGMGRVWIGAVLLAAVTSLPELMTGISSVAFVGEPNLTIGDLFGSNLFNPNDFRGKLRVLDGGLAGCRNPMGALRLRGPNSSGGKSHAVT